MSKLRKSNKNKKNEKTETNNEKFDEFLDWDLNIERIDKKPKYLLRSHSIIKCENSVQNEKKTIECDNQSIGSMSSIIANNDIKSSIITNNDTKSSIIANNDIKSSKQTISQKSGANFRSNFDYILENISKSRNCKKLEIIDVQEIEVNSHSSQSTLNESQDLIQIFDLCNDKNELSMDLNELKRRAEEGINKSLTDKQTHEIKISLKNISSIKDLSFDQIRYLIMNFRDTLEVISSDQKIDSFYRNVFEKYGFPGIAANIKTSIFDKWQQIYIIGCLNGLFENKILEKKKIFGILFPETLLRIVMRINRLSYSQALALINPPIIN
jgi:hypothetical protein